MAVQDRSYVPGSVRRYGPGRFDKTKATSPCPQAEEYPWTARLTANLLTVAARKNLLLTGRVFHTTPKSARAKIMAYLNSVSLQKQSREFDIPFDRQQLADYLNLDRSAMSKELGRMRDEGLIRTNKNHFMLL